MDYLDREISKLKNILMKQHLHFRKLFLVFSATGFFLTGISNLSAQEKQTELKDFKIILEKTESGFKLQSLSGSAWVNLAFKTTDDKP